MNPAAWLLLPGLVLLPVLLLLPLALHGGGWSLIGGFLAAAVQPSLDPALLAASGRGLAVTLAVALWSWLLSLVLGLAAGLLSAPLVVAELCGQRWPALVLRRLLALPRSLHELLWGLLLQGLGLQAGVAILAIALPYGALVARVVSDQVEALDPGPLRALRTAGSPAWAALLQALGPPLLPGVLSYGGYRLECALRSATLLGVFGLGGIGADLRLSLQSLQFREAWTSLWLLGLAMLLLETLVALLRRRWLLPGASVGRRGRELLLAGAVLAVLLLPAGHLLGLDGRCLLGPWSWPAPTDLWTNAGWRQPWPARVSGPGTVSPSWPAIRTPLLRCVLRPRAWAPSSSRSTSCSTPRTCATSSTIAAPGCWRWTAGWPSWGGRRPQAPASSASCGCRPRRRARRRRGCSTSSNWCARRRRPRTWRWTDRCWRRSSTRAAPNPGPRAPCSRTRP